VQSVFITTDVVSLKPVQFTKPGATTIRSLPRRPLCGIESISDGSRDELVDQYEYPFLKFPFYVDCFLSSFTDKTFTGHDYKQHIGSYWSTSSSRLPSDMLSIPHRGRRGSDRMVVAPGFVNYKKGCTRLAAASDKGY
jgi:hypothetical protein